MRIATSSDLRQQNAELHFQLRVSRYAFNEVVPAQAAEIARLQREVEIQREALAVDEEAPPPRRKPRPAGDSCWRTVPWAGGSDLGAPAPGTGQHR